MMSTTYPTLAVTLYCPPQSAYTVCRSSNNEIYTNVASHGIGLPSPTASTIHPISCGDNKAATVFIGKTGVSLPADCIANTVV